jgi:hypothetical protein
MDASISCARSDTLNVWDMSDDSMFEREKIRDPQLTEFAEGETTGTASVILELVPGSGPVARTEPGRGPGGSRSISIVAGDHEAEQRQMDRLERELTGIGLGPLVRLDAAHAFVTDATPGQLRAVTRLPLVGAIRPNRTHSVPER